MQASGGGVDALCYLPTRLACWRLGCHVAGGRGRFVGCRLGREVNKYLNKAGEGGVEGWVWS